LILSGDPLRERNGGIQLGGLVYYEKPHQLPKRLSMRLSLW
jgi:hypothetical protein